MEESREELLKFAKHFERAQGWLLLENHAAAARALRLIPAAYRGRPEVDQFRAQLHLAAGQWRQAVPILRRLRDQDASDPQVWVSLAYATRRAKSLEAAEEILQQARERFPGVAIIWFNLACYAAQQGRFADARDWLRVARRRESAYEEMAKADADLAPYWQAVNAGKVTPPW
ncbi:MAG TPA: tetratricopeptide repeat protein [Lacunisphaera sp.]|nr:tetratricopeptide repeat protein [Lacunisphaera sp.]